MIRMPLVVALVLWPAFGFAAVPALCGDAKNQMEGSQCVARKLADADATLARSYALLDGKLDPLGRRNLDQAKAAWLRFRELECNFETGTDAEHPDQNGTIAPLLFGECAVDLTERRIRDLESQAKCPGGDLSCEP